MTKHFGLPGVGGSLGKCAICGLNFLAEIMMNKPVEGFKVTNIDEKLYGHKKCIITLKEAMDEKGLIDFDKMPDGPLKQAYIKVKEEQNETN